MSKIALVTGGQRGIGFGISQALISAGYKVAIFAQLDPNEPEVAGAMEPQCEGMPNHWGIHMHVDDVDAAAATTVELGGKVLVEAFDCPDVGRICYLADPQGAAFAVIKLNNPI